MKTNDLIIYSFIRLPKEYVFTYEDFTTEVNLKEAVIKALNRMVVSGKIKKLDKDGKIQGYLRGYSVYNGLDLTTQVSDTI